MKTALGVLAYLVLASIFGLNGPLLPGAVAASGSNLNSGSDPPKSGDGGESRQGPSDDSPKSGDGRRSDHGSSRGNDNSKFMHNAHVIAMELSSLTPAQISEYPLIDVSNKDITLVLKFLEPIDLAKVLLNIPQKDLSEIQHRLTPNVFDKSLNRLSEADRTQVEERLMSTSSGRIN
jgi:hypothetical protein